MVPLPNELALHALSPYVEHVLVVVELDMNCKQLHHAVEFLSLVVLP
jgi:hypothetical protein